MPTPTLAAPCGGTTNRRRRRTRRRRWHAHVAGKEGKPMRLATLLVYAAIGLSGSMATGATQYMFGYKLIVKDPNGSETKRSFLVLGRVVAGCDATIVGDPVTNGA